jgi:hypothetical protein
MALRVGKLIVVGAEAATMVCFLAIPAATISVWMAGLRPSSLKASGLTVDGRSSLRFV